jgi:hypothetical protein
MSIGHGLASVAARFLALNRDLWILLTQEFKNSTDPFPPFSKERTDWLSLNQSTAKKLLRVAQQSRKDAVVILIQPIVSYAATIQWKVFVQRRDIDFHRWRPQTAGIAGVSQVSPVVPTPGGGFRVGLGGPVEYRDADTLNGEFDSLVSDAINGSVDAMAKFRQGFRAGVSALVSDRLSVGF